MFTRRSVVATMTVVAASVSLSTAATFLVPSLHIQSSRSRLSMGLLEEAKEAFSAPAPERSSINSDRETPIDRWMGWNVQPVADDDTTKENAEVANAVGTATDEDFMDAMSEANYLSVHLEKPMGIVFEENDAKYQGVFVLSLQEGGRAEKLSIIQPGDQLVAVNDKRVAGISFNDALGTIVESKTDDTMLLFFRGTAEQLYGPTGASKAWLDEFIAASSSQKKEEEEST